MTLQCVLEQEWFAYPHARRLLVVREICKNHWHVQTANIKFKQVSDSLCTCEPKGQSHQTLKRSGTSKGTAVIFLDSTQRHTCREEGRGGRLKKKKKKKKKWIWRKKKLPTGSKLLLLSKNKQVLLLVGFLRGSLNHVNRLSTSFPTCRQGYPAITSVCPPRRVCQLRVNRILLQPSFSRHCSGHLGRLGWGRWEHGRARKRSFFWAWERHPWDLEGAGK